MVLVELKEFIQQYGTPIYAIDNVNGKMYHTFEGGYKLIGERAMLQPQYSLPTSLGSESINTQSLYINILPGTTSMVYLWQNPLPHLNRPLTFQALTNSLWP